MRVKGVLLVSLFLVLPCSVLRAEEEEIEEIEEVVDVTETTSSEFDSTHLPRVDRAQNLLAARPLRPSSLLVLIEHRNWRSFLKEGNDYLGFDAGSLKIGLGVRFGILENLDAGLYRLNGTAEIFDTYEFDARFRFLRQDRHFVDVALRAGLSWFVQPRIDDAVGFFGQLLIDRVFFDRLLVGAGILFHSDSSNDFKSVGDDDFSLAVQALVEWRLISWMAIDLEMAANVAGYGSDRPVVSLGFKFLTHRHTFSLVVANNQYMNADGIVTNTWRGFKDLVLGFQITREFNF